MSEKKGKNAAKTAKEKIVKDTEKIQDEVKDTELADTEAEAVNNSDTPIIEETDKATADNEDVEETEVTENADTVEPDEKAAVVDSVEETMNNKVEAEVETQAEAEKVGSVESEAVEAEEPTEAESVEPTETESVENAETDIKADSEVVDEEIVKATVSVTTEEVKEDNEANEVVPGGEAVTVSEDIESLDDSATDTEAKQEEVVENDAKSDIIDEETPKATETGTEGELVDSEKNKKEAEDKEKAPKKPNKFALFIKAHKALVIIIAIVILLAAGATVTHFILTKDMVFIHKAEDLLEADSGNILVFKKDITIDKDITLEGYSFDMNDHTLTVDGILTINGAGGEDIYTGNRKGKEYLKGGKISAESLIINGTSSTAFLCTALDADTLRITTAGVELYGDINPYSNTSSDVTITNASLAKFYSKLVGDITLGATVDIDFYGSADSITNGNIITAYDGSVCALIEDAAKAVMYPESEIDSIVNVANCVFVEYLAAPELLIIKEGVNFVCYVSEVQNADFYDYSIEGQTGRILAAENSFVLPVLTPGKYDLSVTAGSTNESYNSSKATTVVSVHYTVKLAKPVISVEKSGDTVNLVIGDVDNSTEFVYTINGKEFDPVNAGTIDITAEVAEVGKYTVYVYARNTVDNSYEQSDTAMASYINRVVLAMSEVTVIDNGDDTYTASWTAVENANYYMITEGEVTTYTRATSYTFTEDSIVITVKGTGYYVDSIATTVNSSDAVTPIDE